MVLYRPVRRRVEMADHLSRNWNAGRSFHWCIVMMELASEVASLDGHANDVDSSSNWLMMVVVRILVVEFVRMDHRDYHDGTVHDDVDSEMY